MRRKKDNLTLLITTLAAILLLAPASRAQSDGIVDVSGAADPQAQPAGRAAPPFWSQIAGQADVAFQSYYLSGSGQPLIGTSGASVNLKEFLPGLGLLHANLEGYGGNGFHAGTTFVALKQAPLFGWHWDFVGGDSQLSTNLLANPFNNVYTPDISMRGFRVTVKRKDRSFQFFIGDDTLLGGPRIPYRVTMPQKLIGATLQQNVSARWQFGVRFLHVDTDDKVLSSRTNFFFPGHAFKTSNSVTFQSSYIFSKHVKLYGEMSYGKAVPFTALPVTQEPVSFLIGPTWETDKFTLRANYVFQSVSYLPILGYFSGDRRGPFVEGQYRVNPRIDLYASASSYSNNIEKNPMLPTFHSSGVTGGASFILPWKFNASASLSTLHLTTLDPSHSEPSLSDNRQFNLSVSRSIRRHTLRLSLIDMKLNSNLLSQTQRFTEVEDTYSWRHLVLGGAIRFQGSQSAESRNTIFFRGSIQANIRRVSVYANFEKGSDLVNRSVFSTNAYSSSVAGLNMPVAHGWNLQLEAFRNNLNTALNPQNIFLFPNQNLGATQLNGFNQWSVYFRVGKTFRWGNTELSSRGGDIDQFVAVRVPLVGSVQGLVMEQSLAGSQPAANVVVSLDQYRTAATDVTGRYAFANVSEGSHEVGLDMDQLATDYEPGPDNATRVLVEPRALVRADFGVVRLTHLTGKVAAPAGAQIADVVIRLEGTNRYTTPDGDGGFGFYNLREGEYVVAIDEKTLPEEVQLASPPSVQLMASGTVPAGAVEFSLAPRPEAEKPVRKLFNDQIRVGESGGSPGGRSGAVGSRSSTEVPSKGNRGAAKTISGSASGDGNGSSTRAARLGQ